MHFLLDMLEFLKTLSLQFQQDNLTPGKYCVFYFSI